MNCYILSERQGGGWVELLCSLDQRTASREALARVAASGVGLASRLSVLDYRITVERRPTTTEQATAWLARALQGVLSHVDESWAYGAALDALERARSAGRRWAWLVAEHALSEAYEALGAVAPDATGYDWHRGVHPIQRQARALETAWRSGAPEPRP